MDDKTSPHTQTNFGFIILISCIATIGGFLFGFDSGVINGTVTGLQKAFNSDSIGTGFNVASMLLGCAAGAFFAGRLADHWGRRTLLILAAVGFVISAWGSGIADSSITFIVYRVIGGISVGAASVMAPAYISEIAPARYRGRLITIQQIAIIFGLFSAFLSNFLLANLAGSSTSELWWGFQTWRWMFWIELVPAVIFLLALFVIPESPRFLVVAGQVDHAREVLTRLYGAEVAAHKAQEIDASLAADHHQPQLKDLLEKPGGRVRRIVWVGIGLAAFQQLVGINVVFYYGAVLWRAVGFSEGDALLINVISGGVSIAACVVALNIIDKVGRKPMLRFGSIGMAVTLVLMAFTFSTASEVAGELTLSDNMGILALISANLYVIIFNGTWGPVMWVLLGEMFPNQIRGSGLAVAGLSQWITNFAITMTFPIFLTSIGLAGAYGCYAVSAVISVFFVHKFINETRGIELEDMQG